MEHVLKLESVDDGDLEQMGFDCEELAALCTESTRGLRFEF